MSICNTFWYTLASVVLALVCASYIYMQHAFTYWSSKGVESLQPSFPFGNFKNVFLMKSHIGTLLKDLHFQMKSGYAGIYIMFKPVLLIRDRDLMEKVLITNFDHFMDREQQDYLDNEPLMSNIWTSRGDKWIQIRQKMAPLFCQSAMRTMFNTIYDIGMALQGYVGQIADENADNEVDIRDLSARYLTDVTASVAFGIEVDSIHDPTVYFRKIGAQITDPLSLNTMLKAMFSLVSPWFCNLFKLKVIDNDIEEFMLETFKRTLHFREKHKISRDDFMQMLIEMRKSGQGCPSIQECAAQVFLFFIIGFDSSSSIITFCLYELAKNRSLLKEVQDDIDRALNKYNWKLTYDCIQDMSLLYMCIDETLRMYPMCPYLQRVCTKDFTIPESNLTIKKDTLVFVSNYAIQRDPILYPNPNKFDPRRFSPEEKARRSPMDYLPIGIGPRACNAKELGYLNAAMGLAAIISKFDVELKRPLTSEIVLEPKAFGFLQEAGIHLKMSRRVFRT